MTGPVESQSRRALLGAALVLLVAGVALAALWWGPLTWSATAGPVLDGLGGAGGPHGALGRALRGLGPTGATRGLWIAFATANAAVGVALARRLGLGYASVLIVPLWLLLGPARRALSVVGTEGPLLLASQLALLAGALLRTAPALGAACLTLALTLAVVVSPAGLLMAPFLAVIAALTRAPDNVPARRSGDGSGAPSEPLASDAIIGVPAGPVAIGWAAGVLGALAVMRLLFPEDALGDWWTAQVDLLRRPAPRLVVGGWADVPGVGGPLLEFAQWPALVAALALSGWRRAAAPLALAAAWAGAMGLAGPPLLVDAAAVAVPLLSLAALSAAVPMIRELARGGDRRGRGVAALVAVSLLAGASAELPDIAPKSPLSGLARALPVAKDPTASRPALLLPSDLALLAKAGVPARVFPDRRGARRLLAALRRLHLVGDKARDWDAFSARYVMVRRPAVGPVARAWHRLLPVATCSARACLLTMADGGSSTPRAAGRARRQGAGTSASGRATAPSAAKPPASPAKLRGTANP